MKVFIAGMLLLAAPGMALAQADEWEEQVYDQLDAIYDTLADDGWELERDYYVDSLDEDSNDNLELFLAEREEYAIVGVCDNDCSDIDLYIYDESDTLVAEDAATDDFPVLEFRAPDTGDFRLRVRMYECSAEPCRYGIAVFTR